MKTFSRDDVELVVEYLIYGLLAAFLAFLLFI